MEIYRRISFTDKELLVFKVLDKYKNREINRSVLIQETGLNPSNLSRAINKFNNLGIFHITVRAEKKGPRIQIKYRIIARYIRYKIISYNNKKIIWFKIVYD